MHTHLKNIVTIATFLFPMSFGIMSLTFLLGCNPEDPEPENEEELITTVNITLTPVGGGETAILTFDDPDGIGGQAPDITGDTLATGTTYDGTVELLNKSASPEINVTDEVKEEDDEHLFCYEISGADISITRKDTDGTYEVGIETQWVVEGSGSGEIKVILKHQPDGLKDGTCEPGDTDVEVTFPVVVQ